MKYFSSFKWTLLFPGLTLMLGGDHGYAKPLNSEDVESLLPATPQTKNETVAAIVQDPVVKNAVQYAVGNGSLSGLVVKKNVVIIPADTPDQVLSHRQQIFVAPTSHLEDIRKNITEDLQTETEPPEDDQSEESVLTYQPIIEDDANEMFQKSENTWYLENYATTLSNDLVEDRNDTYEKLKAILPSIKPQVEMPEGTVTQKIDISKIAEKDIPIPVVAVLDPSKETNDKIESSIVALLPNVNPTIEDDRLNYLNANREEIRRDVQQFIDESSLSVNPEIWKRSLESEVEIGSSPTTYDSQDKNLDYLASEKFNLPTIILVPRDANSPYLWVTKDDKNDPSKDNEENMSTAEDIIFRPLFRFRQESHHRSDAYSDRRYNSYQSYDSYPRRRYRPRYSDDYY
ncbi:uncharacterized protein LOC122629423 isoform X1 [Vespula pensylvanica]|uniref:uncharacterized protein LOC122629423 isoform X1 n=1 Tax=Vespula pensylvanica TaxID=30213 RepID=UPI001CBA467E|nr:uncharacterized protein LOC122629423 isoform X1 [Vespula pensylvanica]